MFLKENYIIMWCKNYPFKVDRCLLIFVLISGMFKVLFGNISATKKARCREKKKEEENSVDAEHVRQ